MIVFGAHKSCINISLAKTVSFCQYLFFFLIVFYFNWIVLFYVFYLFFLFVINYFVFYSIFNLLNGFYNLFCIYLIVTYWRFIRKFFFINLLSIIPDLINLLNHLFFVIFNRVFPNKSEFIGISLNFSTINISFVKTYQSLFGKQKYYLLKNIF